MPTISDARSEAARRNGAKSKGPKTEEGKATSSRNALKHGLCAEQEVVAPGDAEGFLELQAALHAQYAPRTAFEAALVERIVSCLWRLRRAVALEAHLLGQARAGAVDHDGHDIFGKWEHRFVNLNRYETGIERSLYRTIKALKEAQAEYDETNPSDLGLFIPEGIHLPDLIPLEEELGNLPNEPKPARRSDPGDIEIWSPGRRVNGPRRYPR